MRIQTTLGKPLHWVENQAEKTTKVSLVKRYLAFCESQNSSKLVWYSILLVAIPALIMQISIFSMYYVSSIFTYWIGFAMLSFFLNVVMHVADIDSKVIITSTILTGGVLLLRSFDSSWLGLRLMFLAFCF